VPKDGEINEVQVKVSVTGVGKGGQRGSGGGLDTELWTEEGLRNLGSSHAKHCSG
jgi:hypothetical protein